MQELTFIVEESPEGGYTARAIGKSIYTEADDLNDLLTDGGVGNQKFVAQER